MFLHLKVLKDVCNAQTESGGTGLLKCQSRIRESLQLLSYSLLNIQVFFSLKNYLILQFHKSRNSHLII